jgi:ribosomal protein S27E
MGVTNAVCTSVDANNHSRICPDCEYTISTEPHNWIYTSINALYHEGHCADCGAVKTTREAHSWTIASDPKYIKCSFCGYLMLKPTGGGGGIIPVLPTKKDDPEEETE